MSDYLVIQGARFGDLVQTKRLMLSLEKQANIHLAIDKSLSGLASILYPFATLHELDFHGRPGAEGIEANRKVFSLWRRINFEKVFNCNFSRLTAGACRIFAEDKVIGNRPAHDFEGGISRFAWARVVARISAMRTASPLNLVDYWACFTENPISPQQVNPAACGAGGGLGVIVAGREARRSLPPPVLAGIVETVFRLLKAPKIRILGSAAEADGARRLMRHFKKDMLANTLDLCGQTDWRELCQEISGLDMLVTPDTGAMHLAAHFGTPVMAFFLSSAWCHETGPYGNGHIVWQAAPSCAPCLESAPCPYHVKCLEPFKSETFGRALAGILAGNGQATHIPDNLQCWKTDVDDFGAIYHIAGGSDPLAAKRQNIRSLIRDYAGLPNGRINPGRASHSIYGNLVEALFPQEEWALPPWRYV